MALKIKSGAGIVRKLKYSPSTKTELIKLVHNHLSEGEYNLSSIDVSRITDMSELFSDADEYLTDWDV